MTEELAADSSKRSARSRSRSGKPVWKEPWATAAGGAIAMLLIMMLFGSGEETQEPANTIDSQAQQQNDELKQKVAAAENIDSLQTAAAAVTIQATANNEAISNNVAIAPPPAVAPFGATQAKEYQQAWADHLGIPVVTTNSVGMKLALIPPGEFMMGSDEFEENEKPVHNVTLTRPFQLGVYEVTQEQYEKVVGDNPSTFKAARNPVEQVSWTDAFAFCTLLSDLPEEKLARRKYRLPTEAEWEYSCRAGTTTEFSFGNDATLLGEFAWYTGNSGKQTHPVGQKRPNSWGLYDMYGNVWERCRDIRADYSSASVRDPEGPASGVIRAIRGGSWGLDGPTGCRSAYRNGSGLLSGNEYVGFRVVCIIADDRVSTTTTITSVESKPVIRESVVAPIQGEYGFTHSNNTYIELRFNRDGTVNELMWTTVSKKQSSKRTSTGGRYIHVSWSRENGSWVYTLYWPNPGKPRHIQRIVFEDSGKIRGFHYGKNGELAITGTKIK